MNIRLASIDDLGSLNELFQMVIENMEKVKHIIIWNNVYPFCEFENDIEKGEMYVIENNKQVIGSFVLSSFDDLEYHKIAWTLKNGKCFYINRLAISPMEQRKGYAKEAMKFIIEYALNNKYDFVRLTVHEDNKYAIGLYEKFGFVRVEKGNWTLDDKIFVGFEMKLKK